MKTSVVLPTVPAAPVPPSAAHFRWRRLLPLVTVMPAIALVLSGLITWLNLGGGAEFSALEIGEYCQDQQRHQGCKTNQNYLQLFLHM